MKVPYSSALNSLHRGQILAALLPSRTPEQMRWVGVYPLNLSSENALSYLRSEGQELPASGIRMYRVRAINIERGLLERGVSLGEGDLIDPENHFARGDDELAAVLGDLGLRIDQLALPYKSDYPI